MVDLDQLVVASLPAVGHRDTHKGSGHDLRSPTPHLHGGPGRHPQTLPASPERERVVALHLGGGIPHQEGPVRHVPQLVVDLLSARGQKSKVTHTHTQEKTHTEGGGGAAVTVKW